jgi:hypothetical protein
VVTKADPRAAATERIVELLDLHPVRARQLAAVLQRLPPKEIARTLEARASGPPERSYAVNIIPPRPTLAEIAAAYRRNKGITKEWIQQQADYRIGEWVRLYARTTHDESDRLTKLAAEALAFDWKAAGDDAESVFHDRFGADDAKDVFQSAIRPWPEEGWAGVEVGNVKFGEWAKRFHPDLPPCRKSNTPADLYRLLYLCEPVGLDFDDMYGCGLFGIVSPCHRFAMNFYLHQYELAAYQRVKKSLAVRTREEHGPFVIKCGIPGADNGVATKDADAVAWFEMVGSALRRSWDVYPGNGFKV